MHPPAQKPAMPVGAPTSAALRLLATIFVSDVQHLVTNDLPAPGLPMSSNRRPKAPPITPSRCMSITASCHSAAMRRSGVWNFM